MVTGSRARRFARRVCATVGPMRTGVIVPVHGWPSLLAETLDGILAQDPRPEVVVVVDDGSPEPVRLLADHAPHCRLVRHPQRRGLAFARATGLAQLEDCELVALCDADDVWERGKHAAQLEALTKHPRAAACFGSALIVGLDGRPTGEHWHELAPGCHEAAALLALLYEHNPLCVSSVLLRRGAVLDAGGLEFELPRAEDWDLWLRMLARGHAFVMEPRARVRYRRSPGALSGDIAGLASAQLHVHRVHAALVGEEVRRRTEAADRVAHARGLVRRREYAAARAELALASRLGPLEPRERALAALLNVPVLRAALGRRDPYLAGARR
jgi:glycosyltransferase involved in cell wall biosynthesis